MCVCDLNLTTCEITFSASLVLKKTHFPDSAAALFLTLDLNMRLYIELDPKTWEVGVVLPSRHYGMSAEDDRDIFLQRNQRQKQF